MVLTSRLLEALANWLIKWLEPLRGWIFYNLNSIALLLMGSLLTLFSSWFVARYTWKAQKDDERRKRIYAPLHDELSNVRDHLDQYGSFEAKEYEQIRSAHLLYLVPSPLEMKIRELYDRKLPTISRVTVELYPKFEHQIEDHMSNSFVRFRRDLEDPRAFAKDLALCVFQGKIISGWEDTLGKSFVKMKQEFEAINSNLTLGVFFQEVLELCSKDTDRVKLVNLKGEARQLIDSIESIIATDLETRFWAWIYRRIIETEKKLRARTRHCWIRATEFLQQKTRTRQA